MGVRKINKYNKIEKKQLLIFTAITFGLPFLMGVLMWYGYENSIDIGIFPGVQMMYPAAGVMAAYWATRRGDRRFPAKFYKTFLIITGLMIIIAVGSVVFPAGVWNTVNSLLLIGGSAVCWMMMLLEESWESREAYGMKNRNTKVSVFCVLLFIVLYLGRILVVDLKGGSLKEVLIMLLSPRSVISVFTIGFSFFCQLYFVFWGRVWLEIFFAANAAEEIRHYKGSHTVGSCVGTVALSD